MTTNDLIKELNDRGYVVSLFNHSHWMLENEPEIPIDYVQSQIYNFQEELDEVFGDIIITIYENDM
jgi:hypothetical protein